MMRKCIVNFSTKEGWFPQGQKRLIDSLHSTGFDGDILYWVGEDSLGCPLHKQVPYAFKTYAFMEAYKKGYDLVLWLDCSMWAIKSVEPVFQHLATQNYLMQKNGFNAGQWCSDAALETLKVSREEANLIPSCFAGGIGLNLNDERARQFLALWHEKAQDGITFVGAWTNVHQEVSKDPSVLGHRHDQTAASVIAYQLGMELQPGNLYISYYKEKPGESVCIFCRGM